MPQQQGDFALITKTKCSLYTFAVVGLNLITVIFPANTKAQGFERGWEVSVHTGRASLDRFTEAEGNDLWHHVTDDNGTVFGGSVSYSLHPNLSVRGLYERANDLSSTNGCRTGEYCLSISLDERGDVEHSAIAFVPELPLSDKVDLFGSIGFGTTRKSAGPRLKGYSENGLVYGAGLRYRLEHDLSLSAEYQLAGSEYNVFRVAFGIRF
ncbi:outer membrane beta-barrel protein [Arsukibacterium indicum]|uniref:Porin family protein n=1 Tax=Arsukibacterium indicum TaxID=2848612 RepID=A0ABS6MLJ8_9GAMM|nr:outer membrane beta-barrel protein [Arsukibacterium indicum]MBV2129176.1 porin family protein [Arsukibacterium indicum]